MSNTNTLVYWENDRNGFGLKIQRQKKTRFGAEPYAVFGGFEPEDRDEIKAFARRIIACVNACAGIPNEVLEGVEAESWCAASLRLIKQRDKLLAALDKVSTTRNIGSAHIVAREAIASAKGGAA